jgi:hypothetical protein
MPTNTTVKRDASTITPSSREFAPGISHPWRISTQPRTYIAIPNVLERNRRHPTVPPNSGPMDSLMMLKAPPPLGFPFVATAETEREVRNEAEHPSSTIAIADPTPACPVILKRFQVGKRGIFRRAVGHPLTMADAGTI